MPRIPAVLVALALLLTAADSAEAAFDVTIVPGAVEANVTAGPNFTATAPGAQIGTFTIATALAGGDVTISTGAGGAEGTIAISAALSSPSPNRLAFQASGAVSQGAPIVVTDVSVQAGGNVGLSNAGNDLGTFRVPSAAALTYRDQNALNLGAVAATSTVSVTADGPITQTGPIVAATGATFVGLAPADITLTHPDNDFNAVRFLDADDVTAVDRDDVELGLTDIDGALSVAAGGITVGSGVDIDAPEDLRLYAPRRDANTVAADAQLNGATFTPGVLFDDSAREQWGVTAPGGTSALPFTFFYADDEPAPPPPPGPVLTPTPTPPAPPVVVQPPPKPTPKPKCTSRRLFDITIRDGRGRALRSATAKLGRTSFRVRRAKGRKASTTFLARLDLRKRPKGTVRISVTATTRTGRTVRSTRTFVLCAPPKRA